VVKWKLLSQLGKKARMIAFELWAEMLKIGWSQAHKHSIDLRTDWWLMQSMIFKRFRKSL